MKRETRRVGMHAIRTVLVTMAVSGILLSCLTPGPAGGGATAGAPAGPGELPEWYLNPQSVYPDDTFLTAVGSGDSRRDAEQQALAGLSQIFEAEIEVDQRTSERYSELMTAQGTVSESEVQLAQNTNVRSNQTLLNVQLGEAAVDELGRVHVIAYIERVPTGRVYMDLISKNSDQIQTFLNEAESSDGMVREYAYLSAAAVVTATNENLRDQLRIIAPGFSNVVNLSYDPDDVVRRQVDLASQMRVSVDINGDPEGRIASLVRAAISDERFPISDQDPVLRVTGSVGIRDGEGTEDFTSVRWNLALNMSGPGGSTLVSYEGQDRAAGVTREAATAFAYTDMEEAVGDEFVAAMRGYFDGLVLGN